MIRKIAKSIREYKKPTLLTPFYMVFEVIMEVLIPLLIAGLIDYGVEKGNMNEIVKYGILLVAVSFVSMLFGVLGGRSAAVASAGFARNLRHDLFYRIQNFSFANIDKFSSSGLVTRLTTDVTNVQNAFQMLIRMAVRSPMTLIFSAIMGISINAEVSLIFLAAMPVLAIAMALMMKFTFPVFTKVFKTYDNLNRVVQENLRGHRVVKAFVREDRETEKFTDISADIYKLFTKAEKVLALNNPLMQGVMYAVTLIISWVCAALIVQSGNNPELGMTTGQLMSLISYGTQALSSLMMLSMIFVMITMSQASMQRIVEVLDEDSTIVSPKDAICEVPDGSIAFRGVKFSYAGLVNKPCLRDVDVEIRSGETIGVIGGTGSGKTSFVQLIPRLYDVTDGSVEVGGHDVREYDIHALRDKVAMVLQKNTLFSGTIKDNLRWGNPDATDEELEQACRLACADPFIRQFPDGYDTMIEQGGNNVSGGQKQRLCIARALLKKPKILILDDSTSAVDTATDAEIRRAFVEDIPDVTKLIIAQRISSVQFADRILVLDGGQVADFGTHEELLARSEIYREVYTSQTKGGEQ